MASLKTKMGRKKWPLILVFAIIASVVGFVLYSRFSAAANKRSFQNARQTIDAVFYDAIKQVGAPDDAKLSSSCSKTYKEFTGYTDLTCGVDNAFIYGVDSEPAANKIMLQIQSIEKNKNLKFTKTPSGSIQNSIVANSSAHTAHDYFQISDLNCETSYVFNTPRLIDLKLKSQKLPFEIFLSCSGPAKQQYYKLAS